MKQEFFWPVRVYYEDTDAGNVVYHANYLKFLERGRTECLRALGFEQDVLRDKYGVLFVVAGVDIRFRRSARFNDELHVSVMVTEIGKSKLVFDQRIHQHTRDGELLVTAKVRVACVMADTFRPCAMPAALYKELHS